MGELDAAAIYQLLGPVAADVRYMKGELTGIKTDLLIVKADLAGVKMELANKADKSDIADLRHALTTYHSAVLGHGILISEIEERVRRIERHVGISPTA
jgi:hypothetical protein